MEISKLDQYIILKLLQEELENTKKELKTLENIQKYCKIKKTDKIIYCMQKELLLKNIIEKLES